MYVLKKKLVSVIEQQKTEGLKQRHLKFLTTLTHTHTYIQRHRQTDRQTDRDTDRQTETQTDRQTETQRDKQTETQTDRGLETTTLEVPYDPDRHTNT